MNPPRNRKGGAGNPPPKGARASALPDNFRGGGWKRGLWRNCEPTSQPKGRGWKPSAYGCARQCPTRRRVVGPLERSVQGGGTRRLEGSAHGVPRVVCGRGRNTTISESAGPCGRLELDFAPQTAVYAAVGLVRRPRCQRPKRIFRPCSRRVAFGSPPRQILHSTPNQLNPAHRSRRRDAYRSISPPPANDPLEDEQAGEPDPRADRTVRLQEARRTMRCPPRRPRPPWRARSST